jgi:hypothetical protein
MGATTSNAPLSAAERARRCRARRATGKRVFRIEVDEERLAGLLVAAGFLHPTCSDIPEAIAAALEAMIANARVTRDAPNS